MYYEGMKTANKKRPTCGQRLAKLRQAAGLSQKELAEQLGVAPSNVGFWELHDKPPRSELLPKLAKILNVDVDEILGIKTTVQKANGPEGRSKKLFDQVSKLPRRKQNKILDVVEALVAQDSGT